MFYKMDPIDSTINIKESLLKTEKISNRKHVVDFQWRWRT